MFEFIVKKKKPIQLFLKIPFSEYRKAAKRKYHNPEVLITITDAFFKLQENTMYRRLENLKKESTTCNIQCW